MTHLAPGLHYGIPASVYHADPCTAPSLSSGIARTICKLSLAHAKLEHPRFVAIKTKRTPALSLGAYVHGLLANDVSGFDVGDFPTFQSAAAKKWIETAEAVGKEPVLLSTTESAGHIAQAVIESAGRDLTLNPVKDGHAEVTVIWQEGDVWCRARFDRLVVDTYADIWDFKTTDDITDRGINASIAKYGYHIQAAFYLRGLAACLPSHVGRRTFTFVFVEKDEPYTVRRVKLSPAYLAAGKRDASRAIELWRSAMKTGEFPSIPVDTYEAEAPAWMDEDEISASEAA